MNTIVAQATAPGVSPRALIRLSGDNCFDLLAAVLEHTPAPPRAAPARLKIPPSPSLPVLVILAESPRSYTTEPTAEILLPGNPHLVERAIAALRDAGAVPAAPGEFTARAHAAGRLTLEQAEGVMALVAAERDADLDAAADLLAGRTGDRYRAIADELAALLALVEAGIDFTDQEDVVPISPAHLGAALTALAGRLDAIVSAGLGAEASARLPRVVLAGPPNAGKSTLFAAPRTGPLHREPPPRHDPRRDQ